MATTIPQTGVVPARTETSVRARATAIPVRALSAIVGVSIAVHVALALWVPAPWIFSDELQYSELAKSFAANGHFAFRGVPWIGLGPVYPVAIAPAYALFHNLGDAWMAAKVTNAVLMSLAAIPAYFLGRRLLTQGWALVAATLTVAVPSTVYVSTITTESVFYPLFLCVALSIIRALERPSVSRQLMAVGLVGLACLTRAQAVALLAAYPTAVVAVASGDGPRGFPRRLRRYWPSAMVGGIALIAVAGWETLHGRSVFAALGKGQGLESRSYSIAAVAKWFVYHVAELDLYVGVLPFAAFIVLAAWSVRKPDRDAFVFTATALSLGFWLLLTVAMFTSILSTYDPHSRSHVFDRYTFYLVPLLLIALCAWASRRVSLSTRGTAIAAVIAGCLPLVLPYRHLIRADVIPDAVGLLPWIVNRDGSIEARPNVVAVAALASFALAALFFLLRRGKMTFLPVLVAALWLGTGLIVAGRWYWVEGTAAKASPPDRAWVDHALPPGATAVAVWSGVQAPYLIWQNEFFNRSVGDVYHLRQPTWQGLPEQKLAVRHSVLVDATGRPLRVSYILADPWLVLRAPVVARDRVSGMRLYRLDGRIARLGVL